MQPIKGIHHIALKCSSEEQYEKTVKFYTEVLGLPIVRTWVRGTMISTGTGLIEIFNNGDGDLPQGVIRHFALDVTDTDACVEKVKQAGYQVFEGPKDIEIPSDPPLPARVAFCYGPLGEEIEFFEEKQVLGVTGVSEEQQDAILVFDGLCKEYPSFRLDNVSFSVRPGRIMGFIGRNGAGKTTTLKCALNLIRPTAGSIRFFGMDLIEHEQEIKQLIGFASGGVDYYNKKKISDIIKVTSSFYDEWDEEACAHYMKLFSLDASHTPSELSAGMKVKLNLVLALSHHAKLLLLDEPTSGLDPVSRDEIMSIFSYLRSQGCAILFSTHVTSDLDKCADDITYIHDGKIVVSTTKEQFIESNRMHGDNVEDIMLYYERAVYADQYQS